MTPRSLFFLVSLLAVINVANSARAGLKVFEGGKALVKVVVPQEPSPSEQDAASELARYLGKVSGVKFDIIQENLLTPEGTKNAEIGRSTLRQGLGETRESKFTSASSASSVSPASSASSASPASPASCAVNNYTHKSGRVCALFVGRTQAAKEWGLPKPDLPGEGFIIKVDGKAGRAVLVGKTDMATKFAVYWFLETFCGVRWFAPTELFELTPRLKGLELLDATHTQKPAFSPRTFGYVWSDWRCSYVGEKDPQFRCDRWAVRNRLSVDGRGLPSWHSHNLSRIIPPSVYGKSNPEYFPIREGKRFIPPDDNYQNWQPCLSNPDVVKIAIQKGRDFFKSHPQSWQWFSLGINDGSGWCECEACQALDVQGRKFRRRSVFSDRYYAFVQKVAEVLLKEFPDRTVGLIAYSEVEPPPLKLKRLSKNVVVVITQDSSQHHNNAYLNKDLEFVRRWFETANGRILRYDYWGLTWVLPRYFPHIIAADLRRMKRIGLKGYYVEDVPTLPTMAPMTYVGAKLLWNPYDDPDKRLKEFFSGLFGNAALPMRRYFKRLEKVWHRPRAGKWFEGLGDVSAQVALFRPSDAKACRQYLEQAERLASDEVTRKRVAFFAQGWKLAEAYLNEAFAKADYSSLPAPNAQNSNLHFQAVANLLSAVENRRQVWESFKAQDKLLCGTYIWMLDELGRAARWEAVTESASLSSLLQTTLAFIKIEQVQRQAQPPRPAPSPSLLEELRHHLQLKNVQLEKLLPKLKDALSILEQLQGSQWL